MGGTKGSHDCEAKRMKTPLVHWHAHVINDVSLMQYRSRWMPVFEGTLRCTCFPLCALYENLDMSTCVLFATACTISHLATVRPGTTTTNIQRGKHSIHMAITTIAVTCHWLFYSIASGFALLLVLWLSFSLNAFKWNVTQPLLNHNHTVKPWQSQPHGKPKHKSWLNID